MTGSMGNWSGGPNQINWPAETFVCRVSGLSTSNWDTLESRVDDHRPSWQPDLIFPVNDCATQVDSRRYRDRLQRHAGARQVRHRRLHHPAAR